MTRRTSMKTSASVATRLRNIELDLVNELIDELEQIYGALTIQDQSDSKDAAVHPAWRKSVNNLLHYLELRRHDIRPLQEKLARLGLSSLGRAEAHVIATLGAVLKTLRHLDGRE